MIDKFILLYAGNLGITSCMEDLLQAAERLKEQKDIQFVIVGEGVKKEWCLKYAHEHQLDNVLFLPYQARERYNEMLAAADVGVATLNPNSSSYSFPNKIINVMASERPALVIAPLKSDLTDLVDKARCGVCVPPGKVDMLSEKVLELKERNDLLEEMGRNGRHYVLEHLSREQCVDQFEWQLSRLRR